MIFGVGIDIEDHTRFEKYHNNEKNIRDLSFLFSENEYVNYKLFDSHLCFAISFSCKEAFFKAMNNECLPEINFTDIELIFNENPRNNNAEVFFKGEALKVIERNNIINPPFFEYKIFDNIIVFETILRCKTKQPIYSLPLH